MTASSWLSRAFRLFLPAGFLLAGIALASHVSGVHPGDLTRDPTAVLQASPFTGLLSNLGVLLWCAAAAIASFTATVLRCRAASRDEIAFFASAAGITAVLLIDDLFRLHDYIFPFTLHIRGEVFYAVYFLASCAFLGRFRGYLMNSGNLDQLVLALVFLGLSSGLDAFFDSGRPWHFLLEDGLKFLGIVSWTSFVTGASLRAVSGERQTIPEAVGSPAGTLLGWLPHKNPRRIPVPRTFQEVKNIEEVKHVV